MMWQLKYQDTGEEGRAEGTTERTRSDLRNLIKNTSWLIEQALSALEVPKEHWEQYIRLIAE